MKIRIRGRLQGMGRWLAIAGALLVVGLLAAPVLTSEPGGDHPNDMDCGNVFWLTPPKPDQADPDYEFYRDKMDRACREARVTRAAEAAFVFVITIFGVALCPRRDGTSSS
ncbi:hypothetical protein ACPPVO_24685 [Dactylosporangium sp. McL0621]|uniref:hypothetical protein n=1 Tax=Dactylosporangium sp. McL0621 TaxID=3415678 RepID=UPI003CEC20FB